MNVPWQDKTLAQGVPKRNALQIGPHFKAKFKCGGIERPRCAAIMRMPRVAPTSSSPLPAKSLDEEVARLHLAKIGVKLTTLRPDQAE